MRSFDIVTSMRETNAISKLAGSIGGVAGLVGVVLFFAGIFGAPRMFAFAGLGLIGIWLVSYFVEEFGPRK